MATEDDDAKNDPLGMRSVFREIGPEARARRLKNRRERIVTEIQRNRRGEYSVPTWVLALILFAIVFGVIILVFAA